MTSLRSSRGGAAGAGGSLGEQPLVQRPQVGARDRAELVAQAHAQVLVGPQRLGDVAARGQRLHQQPVAALAERRRLDDRAAGALGGADARAAELERRAADPLERAQAQLLELAAAVLDPRVVVREQERRGGDVEHVVAGAADLRPVGRVEGGLGALEVGVGGLDVDPRVVRQRQRELAPALERSRAERGADLRQQRGEHVVGAGRRVARPQQLDQLVARHRARPVPGQVGDDEPGLAAAQADLAAADLDRHPPAQADADARQGFGRVGGGRSGHRCPAIPQLPRPSQREVEKWAARGANRRRVHAGSRID